MTTFSSSSTREQFALNGATQRESHSGDEKKLVRGNAERSETKSGEADP